MPTSEKKRFVAAWRALLLLMLGSALVAWPHRPTSAQGATPDAVMAAVTQLDALAADTMARTGVPGMAIAVVYRDEVIALKGYGVRVAGASDPVDADTVFQLASVSKPIASTVVAALVGDGVVTWDDPVVNHLPEFQMYDAWVTRAVTLRDMFAHRSGLPDHAGDHLEDMGYGRDEVLYRLRFQRPSSSFRAAYAYTNFGLTAAGVAAARAAGKSWEDLSVERLYQPLGMTSTSSRHADFTAATNRARGHIRVDDQWVARYDRDPDAQSPAGGVSSTVRDLAQWVRLQLGRGSLDGRQLIAAEALAETHRPQMVARAPADPATDRAGFYGLGWNVSYDDAGDVQIGHSGAFALGAATAVTLRPAEQLGIVVFTNAAPVGAPEAVSQSFIDLALRGQIQQDWLAFLGPFVAAGAVPQYGLTTDYSRPPERPAPPLPANVYVGVYENDYYGEIEVVASEGGGLALRQGPMQTAFSLRHWDRDVFLYQPVGENAAGLSSVMFSIGPNQQAQSVVVENLNIDHQGAFERRAP